jgi:hypothetical protein
MCSLADQGSHPRACYVRVSGDRWQPDEDEKLVELLANGLNWREISEALPGRSGDSCKNRYRNTLANQLWNDSNMGEILRMYSRYGLPLPKDI